LFLNWELTDTSTSQITEILLSRFKMEENNKFGISINSL
jgi:hypothetical protein